MLINFIKSVFSTALVMLNGSSTWLIFSFLLAGILRDVLSPDRFQKHLGNTKISSLIKVTISGMLLPICSCGTIPLGLSMYYSGVYLGPVLAFMTASPIINPATVILSYGLLGKDITIIYLIVGFTLPMIIGIIANKFAGNELKLEGLEEQIQLNSMDDEKKTIIDKIKSGMTWAMNELATQVSRYVITGMLIGGFIMTVFPDSFIQKYLGNPSLISLGNIAILATVMYVCAVGHIPFIAALVASGASPGVALTFLMAGASTNLPELISIYKAIGKRAAMMYATIVTAAAFIVGYLTNKLLMPGFVPAINFNMAEKSLESVNRISFIAPPWFKYLCSVIVFLFFLKGFIPEMKSKLEKVFN